MNPETPDPKFTYSPGALATWNNMPPETPTPRTDEEILLDGAGIMIEPCVVLASFARTLERELIASREECERLSEIVKIQGYFDSATALRQERDTIRDQLEANREEFRLLEIERHEELVQLDSLREQFGKFRLDLDDEKQKVELLNEQMSQLKLVNEKMAVALEYVKKNAVFPLGAIPDRPWLIVDEAPTLARSNPSA